MTTGMKHLAAYQANLLDYNAAKDRECNYIGNQIRAARKSMKLSLEQLSQILMGYGVDIGRVAVNKWEKGISIPSAYQLLAVCAALHLEDGFDYFVSNTKRPLLNAEGRRKVKEYREDLIASGKYREVPPVLEIRYLDMPVSDLPVSAGTGAFWTRETSKWSAFRRAASQMVRNLAFGCLATAWSLSIMTARSSGCSSVRHSVPAKLVS